jgi:hypothetical protein
MILPVFKGVAVRRSYIGVYLLGFGISLFDTTISYALYIQMSTVGIQVLSVRTGTGTGTCHYSSVSSPPRILPPLKALVFLPNPNRLRIL